MHNSKQQQNYRDAGRASLSQRNFSYPGLNDGPQEEKEERKKDKEEERCSAFYSGKTC